ncbi:DUF6625 family protein [Aequorivita nionensis]|uniref:DUF6625 family protein n=1 Tax=Aequorivita nionensis TaxID=1287690 RepID=UPI003965B61E
MKSILLIIPYYGKWPIWFDAYLLSVAANPTVHWLCPTDCEIPENYPSNITFLPITLSQLNNHVNEVVEAEVPLNHRKFCDLKPAYAEIFSEQLQGYDFWGICDVDIIWGDIRKFISEEILNEYDIISSRKEEISGHFNLFRNTQQINSLYRKLPSYKSLYAVPKIKRVDELVLSNYIKNDTFFKGLDLKVFWSKILCNQENGRDSHQEYYLDKWLWNDGKMLELKNGKPVNEVMYLHFINWKRTMKYSEIKYEDNPTQFYISYIGLHYKLHSEIQKIFRRIKNIYNGYYVREYRRLKKMKFKSIVKRVIRRLKKIYCFYLPK